MGYTKYDANTCATSNTNTDFRAWGSWISTAIANSGIVKITGVGEVDWSTAASPATAGEFPAYEIWRFDDALQATAPVYFKLEYGSSIYGNTKIAIALTVGSGYHANLNSLTGACSARRVWEAGFARYQYDQVSYACGDTGRFALAYNANGVSSNSPSAASYTQCHLSLGLERTVDENGDVTGEGVLIEGGAYNTYEQVVWVPVGGRRGGQMSWWEESWGFIMPAVGTLNYGGNLGVSPLYHSRGGPFLNPGYNWMGYVHPDFTANATTTMTYYGATHTYKIMGNAALNNFQSRIGNPCSVMMRWE